MRERTNTGGFELFPVGRYKFTVSDIPEKIRGETGKIRFAFRFTTVINGQIRDYKESFMAWLVGDLLRALGCEEVKKDAFDWDRAEVVGKEVWANIVHEPDSKKPDRKWARMKDIKSPEDETRSPSPSETGEAPTEEDENEESIPF